MFVKDIMTRNPVSVRPEASLRELIDLMSEKTFEAIPVRSNGKLVGMVTDWDVVTNSARAKDPSYLDKTQVRDVMTKSVIAVNEDEVIEMAASHMFFHDLDALPVVDSDGHLVAIVTQNDVFRTLVSLMGLRAKGTRITLDVPDSVGVLADVTGTVAKMGINIASVSTNIPPGAPNGLVILRVKTGEVKELVSSLSRKYKIVHVSQTWE